MCRSNFNREKINFRIGYDSLRDKRHGPVAAHLERNLLREFFIQAKSASDADCRTRAASALSLRYAFVYDCSHVMLGSLLRNSSARFQSWPPNQPAMPMMSIKNSEARTLYSVFTNE